MLHSQLTIITYEGNNNLYKAFKTEGILVIIEPTTPPTNAATIV